LDTRYKMVVVFLVAKPEFTNKKTRADYVSGTATKSVKLDCDSVGYPTPTIKWYRSTQRSGGQKLIDTTNSRVRQLYTYL